MHEETLEFLHMGLQKVKAVVKPSDNKCFIHHFYMMHQYLSKSYSVLGDYEKSAYYVTSQRVLRQKYDFLPVSKLIKSEEMAIMSMKLYQNKKSNEAVEMAIKNVHAYLVSGDLNRSDKDFDFQFKARFIRMTCDLTISLIINMAENLKQECTSIPQAVSAWKKLKIIYMTRQMYLEAVPDDHWAPQDRFALIILLMICHDQINILWKKMDLIFPEHENHKMVMKHIQLPNKLIMAVSKIDLNKGKSELDHIQQSFTEELTNPSTDYYKKIFASIRQIQNKSFVCNYWNVLRKNCPLKSEKKDKRKWRQFKNSSNIVLHAKSMFTQDQRRLANHFQRLCSMKPSKSTKTSLFNFNE